MKFKVLNVTLFITGLLLISCNSQSQKSNGEPIKDKTRVTVYDYQIHISDLNKKELRDSTVLYLDTTIFNNRKNHVYSDSFNIDSTFHYSYSFERDSFFFFDEYCETLDTILIDFDNRAIEVIKSDYDVENSVDEESYIYWNTEFGLISVYNYPWRALILFDNDDISGFAKETFYNFIVNQEKEKHMERKRFLIQ